MLPNEVTKVIENLARRIRALETRDVPHGAVLNLDEQSAPPTVPAPGRGKLYLKNDGKLYFQNDAGVETCLTP